jgi:Ca2+-binding RTX toxin-like protein
MVTSVGFNDVTSTETIAGEVTSGESLASYILSHPAMENDTWLVEYDDIQGGNEQARFVEFAYEVFDPGDPSIIVLGTPVSDEIYGTTGNDYLSGAAGDDTLTGGLGVDTFAWQFNDEGSVGTPATDTVTDFDLAPIASGGDILNIADLLQNEGPDATAADLTAYIHFDSNGTGTTVQISTAGTIGSGYDQVIELNADLFTLGGSDQAIIQSLLTSQKLVTD